MSTTDQYTNKVLQEAQRLLWGGSETENIAAHNMIAKLIKDRMGEESNSQGPKKSLTTQLNKFLKTIDQIGNRLYNRNNNYIS